MPSRTCCSATPTRAGGCPPRSRGASRTRPPTSSTRASTATCSTARACSRATAPTTRAGSSPSSPSATASPTRASPTASRGRGRGGARRGGRLRVRIRVGLTNVGRRAGQEVVQCYVADLDASVARPPRELRAFAKLELAPGERRTRGADARRRRPLLLGPVPRRLGRRGRRVRGAPRQLVAQPSRGGALPPRPHPRRRPGAKARGRSRVNGLSRRELREAPEPLLPLLLARGPRLRRARERRRDRGQAAASGGRDRGARASGAPRRTPRPRSRSCSATSTSTPPTRRTRS